MLVQPCISIQDVVLFLVFSCCLTSDSFSHVYSWFMFACVSSWQKPWSECEWYKDLTGDLLQQMIGLEKCCTLVHTRTHNTHTHAHTTHTHTHAHTTHTHTQHTRTHNTHTHAHTAHLHTHNTRTQTRRQASWNV